MVRSSIFPTIRGTMSSDGELGPTPPKHRRLTRSQMNNSEESTSLVIRVSRSGQRNKIANDDEVCVLSDAEIDEISQTGNANSASRSDPESSPASTLDASVQETSKRTAEARNSAEKDEAGSSSAGVDSDSTESEKCPICWLPYTSQEVATPSICDHRFCFHCIMEWSKTMNTCPVDRQPFSHITVRPKFGSKVTRLVPIETRASTDTDGDTEEHDLDDDDDLESDHDGDFSVVHYYPDSDYNISVGRDDRTGIIHGLGARSSVEYDTTYSSDEDVDLLTSIRVALQYSSTDNGDDDDDDDDEDDDDDGNDSGENADPVVVIFSSSDEEARVSTSSEYNELSSSSSSASPPAYLSPNSYNSSANSNSSSPTNSFSVSLSPTHSQPQSPSSSYSLSSSSSSPPRSFSPSPSTSPSPSASSGSLSDSFSCSSASC